MSTERPILSLVTGSWNRATELRRLIQSIEEHTPVEWELIISDASDSNYPYSVPRQVRILIERPKLTCVQGFNRAFREARGKYCLFLNDDATVLPHYAVEAIAFMEAHPQIGLGALYYAQIKPPFKVCEYWDMVYANFGIISRELGNQIGWFDDSLSMYGNDNSLAFRVLLAGKGIGSIPGARVWHHAVPDAQKIANQVYRNPDADTLRRKYGYALGRMRRVYEKTANLAWPLIIGE